MFYYRFRPFNQLSIKELIYDEIYFASSEESNDPHEGKIFFEFGKDEKKWLNLLDKAWMDVELPFKEKYKEVVSKYLVNHSPMTFDLIQNCSFGECINTFEDGQQKIHCCALVSRLREYVERYKPSKRYFVSFSKDNANYLMWSHYANKHKGYCLIFKTIDGYILQSNFDKRTSINHGSVTAVFGDKFKMNDVVYGFSGSTVDAFSVFPGNSIKDEEERLEYNRKLEQPYLEKAECWEYEQEARLLLPALSRWVCDDNEFSNYERLFRYSSTQLVGIILGARLDAREKEQIKEIVRGKVDYWWTNPNWKDQKYIFDFAVFEASLSEKSRDVAINPIEIYTGNKAILKKSDKGFDEAYKNWKEGGCLEIDESGVRRGVVK